MYTFVYRIFIKFILFCRGQALDGQMGRCQLFCRGQALDALGLELLRAKNVVLTDERMFQCPLGLIPHFYKVYTKPYTTYYGGVSMPSRADISFLLALSSYRRDARVSRCQCPLGLISHFYNEEG